MFREDGQRYLEIVVAEDWICQRILMMGSLRLDLTSVEGDWGHLRHHRGYVCTKPSYTKLYR